MKALQQLQDWYRSQCDGAWEHTFGLRIETLDNPGWSVRIDLTGTELETKPFAPVSHGIDGGSHEDGDDWLVCRIEKNTFEGFGDPGKLETILETFLKWNEAP